MYKNWINGILGLVVVGVAFVDLTGTTLAWTLGVVGAVIVVNSFWSVITKPDSQSRTI